MDFDLKLAILKSGKRGYPLKTGQLGVGRVR